MLNESSVDFKLEICTVKIDYVLIDGKRNVSGHVFYLSGKCTLF